MRLSLFTDYSIRVLMYAAVKEDRVVTTREICDYYKISYHHLVKVVHRLGACGYLNAKKGHRGGFQLAMKASDLKLGTVIRAVEPDFNIVECFDSEANQCVVTPFCRVKKELNGALNVFLETLDQVSIEDVIRNNRKLW